MIVDPITITATRGYLETLVRLAEERADELEAVANGTSARAEQRREDARRYRTAAEYVADAIAAALNGGSR